MSRGFLVDEGLDILQTDKQYKSTVNFDTGLLDGLVEAFYQVDFLDLGIFTIPPNIKSRVHDIDQADRDEFINGVVGKIGKSNPSYHQFAEFLMAPLLTAFNEEDRNPLVIDYRHFMKVQSLHGTTHGFYAERNNPFTLTYLLPSDQNEEFSVANNVTNSKIQIIGNAQIIGMNSNNTSFYLSETPKAIGNHSLSSCCIYLKDGLSIGDPIKDPGNHIRYLIPIETDKGVKKVSIPDNFRYALNHIFLPNDSGGWKEVFPL